MSEGSPLPDALATDRLAEIVLDAGSIGRGNANIEHEREVAIYDLIEANQFVLVGRRDGPYKLQIGIAEDRLVLDVVPATGEAQPQVHVLSLTPMRRVMKDYFLVCETYYNAIRTQPPSKIQAIDMGRRALHDEGSRILSERLTGKIAFDHDTARRLFTLICALHWKG